jgi:hypothetical protein
MNFVYARRRQRRLGPYNDFPIGAERRRRSAVGRYIQVAIAADRYLPYKNGIVCRYQPYVGNVLVFDNIGTELDIRLSAKSAGAEEGVRWPPE